MDTSDPREPGISPVVPSKGETFSQKVIDSSVLDALVLGTMSESVLRNELERIAEKISTIDDRLFIVCKEKQVLEDDRTALESMAKIAREHLAKQPQERMPSVLPGANPPPRRRTGMREHSRKRRIWIEIQNMLAQRGHAIHRSELINHIANIGLVDEDRKDSVANLLSEFRKAELVNTDGHGFWFLPYQITRGVPWYQDRPQQEVTE